jgi:hypothetical protein
MPIIKFPTDDEINAAFKEYVEKLGRVVHAWNYLQQTLGLLFVGVTKTESSISLGIWNSLTDDRAQRKILKGAIQGRESWPDKCATAKDDLLWLVDRADSLSIKRNDVIHSPCSIASDEKGHQMFPHTLYGHPTAKGLSKQVVDHGMIKFLEWCESCAEALTNFSRPCLTVLLVHQDEQLSSQFPWPDRPTLPTLGQSHNQRN